MTIQVSRRHIRATEYFANAKMAKNEDLQENGSLKYVCRMSACAFPSIGRYTAIVKLLDDFPHFASLLKCILNALYFI